MTPISESVCAVLLWCGVIGLCITAHPAFLGAWAVALLTSFIQQNSRDEPRGANAKNL